MHDHGIDLITDMVRDRTLARVFAAFAANDLQKARKRISELVETNSRDKKITAPVMSAVDRLALLGTKKDAVDFAMKLALELPSGSLLRLKLVSKAREIEEKKFRPQMRPRTVEMMTPEEFVTKIDTTPFRPR